MKSLEMLNLDRNHLMEIPHTVSGEGEGEWEEGEGGKEGGGEEEGERREEGGGGGGEEWMRVCMQFVSDVKLMYKFMYIRFMNIPDIINREW